MRRRHGLTDAQWEKIQDLLPGKEGDPGRTAADNRLFVDAVIYVLKTGIPWEDLPARYAKPNTVWKRFDRWCTAGVWERLLPPWRVRTWRKCNLTLRVSSPTRLLPRDDVRPWKKKRTLTSGGAWDAVEED